MSDPRSLENNLVKILAAIGFLIFAYFVIQIFAGVYTNKLTQNLSGPIENIKNQHRQRIAETSDAYEACRLGIIFDKTKDDELALFSFIRATDIDSGYRDAWVWRGYSELKNGDAMEALKSLKRAEDIDPVNPRTYELLAIAYRANEDTDAARKAQEKWEYLTK